MPAPGPPATEGDASRLQVSEPRPAAPAVTPSALVQEPRFDAAYLNNPKPVYPLMARHMGMQGRVLLRVLVSATGTPDKVELKRTSGSEVLDRAAVDAVARWRFVPAQLGDSPVSAWVLVPIVFALQR